MEYEYFIVKTNDNCLDFLVGKKIIKLLFNEEKDSFAFLLDNLRLEQFICEGECCSNSWIEHVSGLKSLLGHTINKIVFIDLPCDKEYGEERTLIYRWDIHTNEGICTMEMRNHSNGYYCGELTHIHFEDDDGKFDSLSDFQNPTIECTEDF